MRVGINVPDELLRRAKEIRPPVNVSQACRDALERQVEASDRARAQAAADGVDGHVKRLAGFLGSPKIEPDWAGYALKNVRGWVRTVTPERWQQFIYQSNFLRAKKRDEAEMVEIWSAHGGGMDLFQCLAEHSEWFEDQFEQRFESDSATDPYVRAREVYCSTWLSYIYEVRRLLEEHHRAQYERVMAEREECRRSLETLELPSQLLP